MIRYLRLIAIAAALAPVASHAQSREPFESEPAGPLLRDDVAGSRQPSGMEPTGVHIGPLLVQPSVAVRAEADSNVLNRSTDKKGDVYVVLQPAVKAKGENGNTRYVVLAEAAIARYAKETSQDTETFGVEGNAQLSLTKGFSLFARISHDRKVEPPASAGEAEVEGSPAEYDEVEGVVAARVETGAMRFTAAATATRREYADIEQANGLSVDQGFRDTESLTASLEAEHASTYGANLFVLGKYKWIDSISPASISDRSSQGGQLLGGLRADLSNLVTAEAGVGYVFLNYESPAFKDFGGLAWSARLEWYATPLVSLSLTSGRTIVNSGIPDVAGVIVDTTSLKLFYELRRNLDVVATLAHSRENYREADTKAQSTLVGVEGRYVFGPRYAAGIFGRLRLRDSSGSLILRGGSGVEGGAWLRVSI